MKVKVSSGRWASIENRLPWLTTKIVLEKVRTRKGASWHACSKSHDGLSKACTPMTSTIAVSLEPTINVSRLCPSHLEFLKKHSSPYTDDVCADGNQKQILYFRYEYLDFDTQSCHCLAHNGSIPLAWNVCPSTIVMLENAPRSAVRTYDYPIKWTSLSISRHKPLRLADHMAATPYLTKLKWKSLPLPNQCAMPNHVTILNT